MIVKKAQRLQEIVNGVKKNRLVTKEEYQLAVFELFAAIQASMHGLEGVFGTVEEAISNGREIFLQNEILRHFRLSEADKQKEGVEKE